MIHICCAIRALPAAILAVSTVIAAPALATPGSGFTPTPLANGAIGPVDVKADKAGHWDLKLTTKDDSNVNVTELTVAPAGYSGWHAHPMPIVVTVTAGTIEWVNGADPLCASKTYHAGESFIEPANSTHLVRNATGSTAEFIAFSLRAQGDPVTVDKPQPNNCAF